MKIPTGVHKSVAVLATAVGVFAIFFLVDRPWFLRWGATPAEVSAARPGDEFAPDALDRTTRAVTINAPDEDAVWGFALDPIDARTTRLIAWGRGAGENDWIAALLNRAIFAPVHYVMERRMLLNIKALAEGRVPSKWGENTAVALWILTVALIVAALIQVVRLGTGWGRGLLIAAFAALAFQFLTLLQPPLPLGILVALAVGAALVDVGA